MTLPGGRGAQPRASRGWDAVRFVALAAIALLTVFPLVWMATTPFKPPAEA